MTWYHKTVWALQNLAVPAAVFISIFYWTILFEGDNSYWCKQKVAFPMWYVFLMLFLKCRNVYVHGFNSLYALLDVCLSAKPWRLHHIFMPLIFGLW